jgi:hypothetical protein
MSNRQKAKGTFVGDVLVKHDRGCPAVGHTDAALRVADEYTMHRLADPYGTIGKWFAANLGDGKSDHVLYDTKREAILHQHHNESWYTYIQIGPHSMSVCAAEVMLKIGRRGVALVDPEHVKGGREIIKRISYEDQVAQSRGITQNLTLGEP